MISRLSMSSLALCLGALSVAAAPAAAAPLLISQSFTPPPNSGAPPSTTAGASRNGAACENIASPTVITPLMPKLGQGKQIHDGGRKASRQKQPYFSLTLQERPSFFWHVSPASAGTQASFLLVELDPTAPLGKRRSLVYEALLDLPEVSGFVQLDLPQTAPALRQGRQYEWFLSFNCNPIALDSQVHLSGWVELAQPSSRLAQQLAQASLSEQARLLAKAGIWQDALMSQIELQQRGPGSIWRNQRWQTFLTSVGLGQFAAEPILSARVTEILAY